MLKKRQNEVKRNNFLFDEVKTKPEEFRKRLEVKIQLNAIQIIIKQNVPSLIYDYLETKSWNKKVKTIKSNLLKYDKKIWSNSVINWDPDKTISAKITASKQLALTKNTCVNFEKILKAKIMKKKALKNNFHGKTWKSY